VASLLIKADKQLKDGDTSGYTISLTLAERMLAKFIKENKSGRGEGGEGDKNQQKLEESILILYLEVLAKQKKWEQVLTTLKEEHNYPNPQEAWNSDYFYEVYTQSLLELGRRKELFDYLRACYFKK